MLQSASSHAPRSASWPRWPAAALAFALALVSSFATTQAPAMAGKGVIKTISCPMGGSTGVGATAQPVGSFDVSCSGAGGSLVTIVAIGTTCGTQGQTPTGTCDLRLEVAGNSATILGASVMQSGAGGTSSTHFLYQTVVWTYTVQGPGGQPEPVQITATTVKGVGVAGASSSIQDTKNVADGAAKSQAVE